MTKAILVVSFGTTFPETRQKTIEACENAIQQAYPDCAVYRAFTSTVVIRRIKAREGIVIPTVSEALNRMQADGIRDVFIQPLHIILGGEYDKIVRQSASFKNSFDRLEIAKPLLCSEEDYVAVRDVLVDLYGHFGSKSACILMGHGSQHYAFVAYAALDHMLEGHSIYIGCVESYPPVDMIEKKLKLAGVTEVHLAPFMLVAGDHAVNDLMSDDEDSWKTYFKTRGYDVVSHLVGMGEYPAIQQRYIEHLAAIMD